MEIRGRAAERRSAAAARVKRGLSWKAWAADLDEHLDAIDQLMWPNLMILGGGVSKNADRFIPRLTVRCPVVPAQLRNDAGIIGAAIVAAEAAAWAAVAPRPDGPTRARLIRPARAARAGSPPVPDTMRFSPARQDAVGRRVRFVVALAADDRQREDPVARAGPDRPAVERPAGRDLDLLDRERELAVRQRESMKSATRGRTASSAICRPGPRVRRHDAVAPGLQELGLGALLVGPGDDEQAGLSARAESVT